MKLQIFNNGWQDVQGVKQNTFEDEITKDESYDNATVEARNTDNKLCERWSKFRTIEDDGEIRYYYGSDTVTRIHMSKWYLHKYELVEPTKYLERFFLSGLSCTQNNPDNLKTLPYIIDKAIADIKEKYGVDFFINTNVLSKLYKEICPEYVITAKTTFFEFLTNYIGKKISAMPRLLGDANGNFNEITFDYFADIFGTVEIKTTGEQISKPQDSSATYLEAEVSNLITENEDELVLTYPGRGLYISVRTEDFVLEDTNADIILPYNIKEIKKVSCYFKNTMGVSVSGTNYEAGDIFLNGEYDITDQLYTQAEWEALKEGTMVVDIRQQTDNKRNTFYYKIGDNKIYNVGGKNKAFLGNWRSLIAVMERHFYKKGYVNAISNITGEEIVGKILSGGFVDISGTIGIYEIYLKVEYVPYSNKIITTQVNPRNKTVGSLTFNQSAENTNSQELGNAMWNELQNTNSDIKQMTARVSDKTEIKGVGDIVDNRIITSVKRRFTGSKWINVLYTANEEFIRRSQYIEENREYRPYAIPQETIVDRHLHTDEFCYIDYEKKQHNNPTNFTLSGINVFAKMLNNVDFDYTISNVVMNTHAYIDTSDEKSLFLLSTVNTPLGKTVQFNWLCEDNISVGRYLTAIEENRAVVEKATYTDVLGGRNKLSLYFICSLGDIGLKKYNYASLPKLLNGDDEYGIATPEKGALWYKTYDNLQKDAGERFLGALQLHFVTLRNDIAITNNFANRCPLLSNKRKNLRFVLTDYRINKYTESLPSSVSIKEVDGVEIYGASEVEKDNILIHTNIDFLYPQDVSWAIIDENNDLYLGGSALDLVRQGNGDIYLTFTSRML